MHILVQLLFVLIACSIVFGWANYSPWGRTGGATGPGGLSPQSMISILISLVVLYIVYTFVIRIFA